ncbi:hypothetical protein NSQ26_01815 [Bacillus sp. FSL W7-1360]
MQAVGIVAVIDGSLNPPQVVATVSAQLPIQPFGQISVNTTTNIVYTAGGGSYSKIDMNTTPPTVTNIPLANNLLGTEINPLTNTLYVLRSVGGVGTVLVVDANTDTLVTTITLSLGPPGGAMIDIFQNKLYTTINASGGGVNVIDGATNTIVTVIPTAGTAVNESDINPLANRLYVGTSFSVTGNRVFVIDTTTDTVIETITVGSNVGGVALNPITAMFSNYPSSLFFVPSQQDGGSVAVINQLTNTIVTTLTNVGAQPRWIGLYPFGVQNE